jgi:hypothetical protein
MKTVEIPTRQCKYADLSKGLNAIYTEEEIVTLDYISRIVCIDLKSVEDVELYGKVIEYKLGSVMTFVVDKCDSS